MRQAGGNLRFLVATGLLLSAIMLLNLRYRSEILPKSEPLAGFPIELGAWKGQRLEISEDVRQVLGPGSFLSRIYQQPQQTYVDLFVAYFPSQRAGDAIHSPKNCLPGSGWMPLKAEYLKIPLAGRPTILANRYIIAKGEDRRLVIYWYQAHGRTVASEYWAKVYLVLDALRLSRTDGSMVRITSPITRAETEAAVEQRVIAFARAVAPHLDGYIPQ